MGATKKRRQTKHRGNAAGMVESRGRTNAGSAGANGQGAARGPRVPGPPSWQKAFTKALIPLVLLLVVMPFLAKDKSLEAIVPLALLAYAMYVPISYYSDKWVYDRFLKKSRA